MTTYDPGYVHVYPIADVDDAYHKVEPIKRVERPMNACWLCQQGVCVQRVDDAQDNLIIHGMWRQ